MSHISPCAGTDRWTDGWRSLSHARSHPAGKTCTGCRSLRKKPGCLLRRQCCCLLSARPRSCLGTALPSSTRPETLQGLRSSRSVAVSGRLLLPLFCFCSSSWILQFVCGRSSWMAVVSFSSNSFQVQLTCSFRSFVAAPRLFQVHLMDSSSLVLLPVCFRLQLDFIFSGFILGPAYLQLQFGSISSWSAASAQVHFCSGLLQLVLVHMILAFDRVVNQSLLQLELS